MPHRVTCTSALVLALGAATAYAEPPAIRIDWSVNGGPTNTLWPEGVGESENAVFTYDGTTFDQSTGVALDYQLTANPYASIGGNLQVFNDLDSTIDINVQVVMEFTPTFLDSSELSGQVAIGLVTGPGGGEIGSQPPAAWRAVIDESIVGLQATLFHHPFMLSNGGQGSSSTQQTFGIPFPVPGPPISQNVGYALAYTLTSLDTASVTSGFTANGEALTCTGDINISGSVGPEDLNLMLAAWGACTDEACVADLDGDNEVGILDALILLSEWGSCL